MQKAYHDALDLLEGHQLEPHIHQIWGVFTFPLTPDTIT